MSNSKIKYLKLLTVTILLFNLTACKQPEKVEVLRPVRFTTVHTAATSGTKDFAGVIHSNKKSLLSFKVNGSIKEIIPDIGQKVNKGQLLATLDPEPYIIQLQELEARSLQAKANAKANFSTYDRYRKLYIDGATSEKALDDMKAASESSSSVLKSVQKAIEYARLQLRYTKLYAPMNGYITEKYCESGENIPAGKKVFAFITSSQPEVKVDIPESYINLIKKDMPVMISIDSIGGEKFKGLVKEVGVDSQLGTATYPVIVSITAPSSEIHSGMTANVEFQLEKQSHPEIIIPITAVSEDENGKFIYILKPINKEVATIQRRGVEIKGLKNNGFEITEGIQDDEKVVIAGVSRIKDGQNVKYSDKFGE